LAVLSVDVDERGYEFMWLDLQASPYLGFWHRLRLALSYVAYPLNAIKWDSVVIGADTAKKLRAFLSTPENP